MEKNKRDIVKMLLNQNLYEKDEEEIIDLLINNPITVDVDKENDSKMTVGDILSCIFTGSYNNDESK